MRLASEEQTGPIGVALGGQLTPPVSADVVCWVSRSAYAVARGWFCGSAEAPDAHIHRQATRVAPVIR